MEELEARLVVGISSGQEVIGGDGVVLPDMPEGKLSELSWP